MTVAIGIHNIIDNLINILVILSKLVHLNQQCCYYWGKRTDCPIESVFTKKLFQKCDLNSRRGQVGTMENRGNAKVFKAKVPLANMFGYVNNLRSMSQGRAQFTMQFDYYAQVPQNVAEEIKSGKTSGGERGKNV